MPVAFLRFAACLAALLAAAPAAADDAPFLTADPASVMAKGEHLIEQWLTWSTGHAGESYNALESLSELDYGLSDRIQLGFTLAYDWDRTRPPGGSAATSNLIGLQAEAVFILAPVDTSFVGAALAVDPSWNRSSRAIALRILLTKYTGRFEHVLNINFEDGWDSDDSGGRTESGVITFNYGLGRPIGKHWTLALEIGNEIGLGRLVTAGNFRDAAHTVFVGPTAEYDCKAAVFTFGVQMQLPLASGHDVVNGYRSDTERWRVGFRVARSI